MLLEQGSLIAGKFRLERPLAKGGMGAVWVARHMLLDTEVAIKFIDPERTASQVLRARFLQEAKASLVIKSPHVVQVLDYGIEGDTPFMVMELLEGEDFRTYLKRKGRLSLEEAYRILEPLGKALRRAHSIGLVHRDIKPSNIFLARCGDEDIVKLLDFGIVKQIHAQAPPGVTSSSALLGSPHYMSPEQVQAKKQLDHRSDLWAMGVILYEALTGHAPFEHEALGGLLIAICSEPWLLPSKLVPELGAGVDRFFVRALKRDPAARFQSVDDLVDAFAPLAGARAPLRSSTAETEGEPKASSEPWRDDSTRRDAFAAAPRAEEEAPPRAPPSTLSPSSAGPRAKKRSRSVIVGIGAASMAMIGAVAAVVLRSEPGSPVRAIPAGFEAPSWVPSAAPSPPPLASSLPVADDSDAIAMPPIGASASAARAKLPSRSGAPTPAAPAVSVTPTPAPKPSEGEPARTFE